jgi:hypothetical protein
MAETINKIFSKGIITDTKNIQKVRYNRDYLLSKQVADELNTYRTFGVFPTFSDSYKPEYKNTGYAVTDDNGEAMTDESGNSVDEWAEVDNGTGTPGVRSIFNRTAAVLLGSSNGNYDVDVTKTAHEWRIVNNTPLMDSPETRRRIRKHSGCSVKELVDASAAGMMGRATYSYSDFMYCKHLGKVPNNYMITLRRFPLPVDDFIGAQGESSSTYEQKEHQSQNATQIGCMVTWMGVSGNDLNSLLKYTVKMPFEFKNSEEGQQAKSGGDADGAGGKLGGMFNVFDSKYRAQYMAGQAGDSANSAFGFFGIKSLGGPPYKGHIGLRDDTKIYGPVDGIKGTYMRSNKGIEFDQKLTLVFEYELKSYNGINPRQAMLDLLSNILTVTYTTGTFFGGSYRGTGAHQSNIFANLNIFKCRGGFTDFVDAFAKDISEVGKKAAAGIKANGGIMQTLNQIGGMLMAGLLNSFGRPAKAMYNSLLSPAPIGFWHVTIGNPKHPIMSIGNMVVTDTTIEHMGPLGLDDFPTGIKVTVQLDRGKPRDLRDIEKLYMQGNDRIYAPMGNKVFDMYHNAEMYKSYKAGKTATYNPKQNIATVDTSSAQPTVDLGQYSDVLKVMKRYFGTNDAYSIWVPAAEQEFGSGKKKPSTKANKYVTE